MKTTKINIGIYKVELNGTTWSVEKANGYWRADDGEQVMASKTKKGAMMCIEGDTSKMMFHEWI